MRRSQRWGVGLLVSVVSIALTTPSLSQSRSSKELRSRSLTLEAAVKAAERGEYGDEEREQLAQRGRLLATEQQGYILAEFELDDAEVRVTSEAKSDGRVELLAEVAGISLDALYDPGELTIHLDGHGSTMGLKERVLLQAFAFRLTTEDWDPTSSHASVEKRLAYRLINFLSEAPVGFRFDAQTIQLPEPVRRGGDADDSKAYSSSRISLSRQQDEKPFLCSNVNDQDGISYGSCLPAANSAVWHDACPQHGFASRTELVGCNQSNSCLGRCGAGCAGTGAGIYTEDCEEHDSCCREHGGCANPGHGSVPSFVENENGVTSC